jgi:hypothetical protein
MATIAPEPPWQAEGSGLFTAAWFNIKSSPNGGLESALQAMKQMGVDCGILLETKLTKGVYLRWSLTTAFVAIIGRGKVNIAGWTHMQQVQCPKHPCTKQVARRN